MTGAAGAAASTEWYQTSTGLVGVQCHDAPAAVLLHLALLQETIEKTDASGKLLPEMVRWQGGKR